MISNDVFDPAWFNNAALAKEVEGNNQAVACLFLSVFS
jgi:hypothetical protein